MRRSGLIVVVALFALLLAGSARASALSVPAATGCLGRTDQGCAPFAQWDPGDGTLRPKVALPTPDGKHLLVVLGRETIYGPGGYYAGVDGVLAYRLVDGQPHLEGCLLAAAVPGCVRWSDPPVDARAATLTSDGTTLLLGGSEGVGAVDVRDPAAMVGVACAAYSGGTCAAPAPGDPYGDDDGGKAEGIAVTPDGRDVYVTTDRTPMHHLRRDAAGHLTGTSCRDGGCSAGAGAVWVTADGHRVITAGGNIEVRDRLPDGHLLLRSCMGRGPCPRGASGSTALGFVGSAAPGPDGTIVALDLGMPHGGGLQHDAPAIVRLGLSEAGDLSILGCSSDRTVGCSRTGDLPTGAEPGSAATQIPADAFAVAADGTAVAGGPADVVWRPDASGELELAGCVGQVPGCAGGLGRPITDTVGGAMSVSPDGRTAWHADGQEVETIDLAPSPTAAPAAPTVAVDPDPAQGRVTVRGHVPAGEGPLTAWIEDRGSQEVRRTPVSPDADGDVEEGLDGLPGPRRVTLVVRGAGGETRSAVATYDEGTTRLDWPWFGATDVVGSADGPRTVVSGQVHGSSATQAEVRWGETQDALTHVVPVPAEQLRDDEEAHGIAVVFDGAAPDAARYVQLVATDGARTATSDVVEVDPYPEGPARPPDSVLESVAPHADGTADVTVLAIAGSDPLELSVGGGWVDDPWDDPIALTPLRTIPPGDVPERVSTTIAGLTPGRTYLIGVGGSTARATAGSTALRFTVPGGPATGTTTTAPTTTTTTSPPTTVPTTATVPTTSVPPTTSAPPSQTQPAHPTAGPSTTTAPTPSVAPAGTTTSGVPSASAVPAMPPLAPGVPPGTPSGDRPVAHLGLRVLGRVERRGRLVVRLRLDAPEGERVVLRITAGGRAVTTRALHGTGAARTVRLVLSRTATARALRAGGALRATAGTAAGTTSAAVPRLRVSG